MNLVGLPDFSRALSAAGAAAWRAFGRDEWLSLPTGLDLAEGRGRLPDIQVSMFRGRFPGRGPEPFGQMRASFKAAHDDGELLGAIRKEDTHATLHRALPAAGTITLISTSDESIGEQLDEPFSAEPYGATGLRIARRLTPEGASLFAQMIEQGTMPISASVALRYEGVAPRAPSTAVFETQEMADALTERIEEGRIEFASFLTLIGETLDDLPVEFVGLESSEERDGLTSALADRLALRFADPLASRDGALRFTPPEDVQPLRVSIDLSIPVRSARWVNIIADPFAALRGEDAVNRASNFVSRNELMPIPTGAHRIEIFANLPVPLVGVERMGVVLRAPAMPPMRPHPISTTILFQPEELEQSCDIHLAPGEDFEVTAQAFALLHEDGAIRRVTGAERTISEDKSLILSPPDFGFEAITIEAGDSVLQFGTVEAALTYIGGGRETGAYMRIDPITQQQSLALPLDARDAQMVVSLNPGGDRPHLPIDEGGPRNLSLGLNSIPGYGTHVVSFLYLQSDEADFAAIEVVGADERYNQEAFEILNFSSERTRRTWKYFARNPFAPGFFWRHYDPGQTIDEGWIASEPTELVAITPLRAKTARGTTEAARSDLQTRQLAMTVDFGNGAKKSYTDIEIPSDASIHDVLASARSWEPPLTCKIATLFTDRGGTDRNFLESVDGIEGNPRGASRWSIKWDRKAVSLDRAGVWAPPNRVKPKPIDPSNLPTGKTSIALRLVEESDR